MLDKPSTKGVRKAGHLFTRTSAAGEIARTEASERFNRSRPLLAWPGFGVDRRLWRPV